MEHIYLMSILASLILIIQRVWSLPIPALSSAVPWLSSTVLSEHMNLGRKCSHSASATVGIIRG